MIRIGTDIVLIRRIENAIDKHGERFKRRFLSEDEIKSAKNVDTLAGYWAAKEAIAKALGCGIGTKLRFGDIIISKDTNGAPYFKLSSSVLARFEIKESSLSISHDGGFAIAVAAIEI